MKKIWNEFREFAFKGNVIDMAVGVVVGAAFSSIVSSLVGDIISPLIGLIFNQDFSTLTATIGDVQIAYGSFISAVINFFIVAIVLFLFIKGINSAKKLADKAVKTKSDEPVAPAIKVCPYCKSEIALDATRCPHCTSKLDD